MEPDSARKVLNNLLKKNISPIDESQMQECFDAIISIAKIEEGYAGLAWKAGNQLLKTQGVNEQQASVLFEEFGWKALANGIESSLAENRYLKFLCFADSSFLPYIPLNSVSIFDHPVISQSFRESLSKSPISKISVSDLASLSNQAQKQFGDSLSFVSSLPGYSEVKLHWSACALRVFSISNPIYKVAATVLAQELKKKNRAIAYYAFRAIAQQCNDLWQEDIVINLHRGFIEYCLDNDESGKLALSKLMSDEELLRICLQRFDLMTLLGVLSIYLIRSENTKGADTFAWRFINELFNSYSSLAQPMSDYLTTGDLPVTSQKQTNSMKSIKDEFQKAVQLAENELHPRSYAQLPLARKIYQHNINQLFNPILQRIKSGNYSPELMKQLQEMNAEALIQECHHQKDTTHPVVGKLLRKLEADHNKIISLLTDTLKKRVALDQKSSQTVTATNKTKIYDDVTNIVDASNREFEWAMKKLLPALWSVLNN